MKTPECMEVSMDAEHDHLTLEDNIFDTFMDACANAAPPNQVLQDANALATAQGIM